MIFNNIIYILYKISKVNPFPSLTALLLAKRIAMLVSDFFRLTKNQKIHMIELF